MTISLVAATAALLLRIPTGPVFLVAYAAIAAFVYLVLALVLNLPLPGARRGEIPDDEIPPEYHGRGAPRGRVPPKDTRRR